MRDEVLDKQQKSSRTNPFGSFFVVFLKNFILISIYAE